MGWELQSSQVKVGLQCHCLFPWMATGGAAAKAEEPGSVRIALWAVIPGPPVQGHCSVLTVADGDDSQSNKSWLHMPSWEYYLWKPGLRWCLQCHVVVGILQRLSVELPPCRSQNPTTLGQVRETNGWGRQYRVGKITGGLHLSLLLLSVATITGFPPHFPCCT